MSFWQLGTVQHCLSVIQRLWFFMNCILVTLKVNDDDDENVQKRSYLKAKVHRVPYIVHLIRFTEKSDVREVWIE